VQTIAGPGQLVIADTTLISTGLFVRANEVDQQPRSREDFNSISFPAGWMLYLSIAVAVIVAVWLIGRSKKSRKITESPDEDFV
jgi:hypothetical protein